MIHENEIRLGNWFQMGDNPEDVFQWSKATWYLLATCRLDLSRVHSIALTPDVLFKRFGFVFESGNEYVHRGTGITMYLIEGVFEFANNYFPIKMPFVHQLQTLCYSLTGIELEITL